MGEPCIRACSIDADNKFISCAIYGNAASDYGIHHGSVRVNIDLAAAAYDESNDGSGKPFRENCG